MKKSRKSKLKLKDVLLFFFFIMGGIIKSVPEDETVNQKYYREVLIKPRESVKERRPDLWKNESWILRRDNEPVHNALTLKQILANVHILVSEYTSYSSDLAPCDFYVFLKVEKELEGQVMMLSIAVCSSVWVGEHVK